MQRISLPISLLAIGAALVAAPAAGASPKLPPGADAPPRLPPGVVTADVPPVGKAAGQSRSSGASTSTARRLLTIQEGPPPFWATVNICDTEVSPNSLGVRTSVPGNGSGRRVYARYTAQWWSRSKQSWLTVGGSGRTDWVYLGTQDWSAPQGGWTFRFSRPPAGTTYVVRGVVELNWRDRRSVVRRRALLTETGKTGVGGGDPVGTSKALCLIW